MERTPHVRPETVPRIVLGTRIRRFRGVVMVSTGPSSFELADSGAFLFCNLDGRTSVREIANRLVAEYGVEESEALTDTTEFVEWLITQGVVTLSAEALPPPVG